MQKAIIVGATSGIGRGLALILTFKGYKVGITGRRSELLNELRLQSPDHFMSKTFDIRETATIPRYLDELVAELGGLDLLVISSGTGELNDELEFALEKSTIETNVSGFTCIADWSFNFFCKQGFGHLAAITSIAGLRGGRQAPAYNASKAYQINYLEAMRQKAVHQKLPITITDIRPGFVDTAMARSPVKFWVAPVPKAVQQIYSAIKDRKKVAYITKRWALIALLFKLLPGWIYERV